MSSIRQDKSWRMWPSLDPRSLLLTKSEKGRVAKSACSLSPLFHHKGDPKSTVASWVVGQPVAWGPVLGCSQAAAQNGHVPSVGWGRLGLIFYQSPGGHEKFFHETFQGRERGRLLCSMLQGDGKAFSQDLDSLMIQCFSVWLHGRSPGGHGWALSL